MYFILEMFVMSCIYSNICTIYKTVLCQIYILLKDHFRPISVFDNSRIGTVELWYINSSLNLPWHSANAVVVLSRFFLMMVKFCNQDNFNITLVKTIRTPINVFTLFQALSCRHSRSLVIWFTAFEMIQHKFTRSDSSPNHF